MSGQFKAHIHYLHSSLGKDGNSYEPLATNTRPVPDRVHATQCDTEKHKAPKPQLNFPRLRQSSRTNCTISSGVLSMLYGGRSTVSPVVRNGESSDTAKRSVGREAYPQLYRSERAAHRTAGSPRPVSHYSLVPKGFRPPNRPIRPRAVLVVDT